MSGMLRDAFGIGTDVPALRLPHTPRQRPFAVIAWHHGLRHAVKAIVLFPLIFLAVSVASNVKVLVSSAIVFLIPRLAHVAVLGGVAGGVAVLVAVLIRPLFTRGVEGAERWAWSEPAVRIVTISYGCVVFYNMIVRQALPW